MNNPVLCDRRHPITLFLFLFVKRQTRRKKNIFLTLQSVQLIIPCLDKVVKCVAYCKSSSSVIAETAGVTFSLSASVEYRHTVEQCTDIQDLPITSQYELRNIVIRMCWYMLGRRQITLRKYLRDLYFTGPRSTSYQTA